MSYGIAIPVGNCWQKSRPRAALWFCSAAPTPPVVDAKALTVQSPSFLHCDCAMPAYVGDLPLHGGNVFRSKVFFF